jgi:hypothetical protein
MSVVGATVFLLQGIGVYSDPEPPVLNRDIGAGRRGRATTRVHEIPVPHGR